jgi:hypothetical protein
MPPIIADMVGMPGRRFPDSNRLLRTGTAPAFGVPGQFHVSNRARPHYDDLQKLWNRFEGFRIVRDP